MDCCHAGRCQQLITCDAASGRANLKQAGNQMGRSLGLVARPASVMRYASFAAPKDNVDISVVTFPGDGGDDLGNINRWRQQLGLPPADANASNIVPLKTNETTFSTIDIAGANTRTVAAWTRKDGRAWFFKLTGPTNGVEKERPNFVKFVQSVRF